MSAGPGQEARRNRARRSFEALGGERRKHRRLVVACARNHHVAEVYDADGVLVVLTSTGPRAHGRRDFVDTAHGPAHHGRVLVDDLDPAADPTADDELPAVCECGPRTLSRAALLAAVRDGEHHLRVD